MAARVCYTLALLLAASACVSVQARDLTHARGLLKTSPTPTPSPVPSPVPSPSPIHGNATNSTNSTLPGNTTMPANTTYGEIQANPKLQTTAMLINATGLTGVVNNLTDALLILPSDVAWFLYLDAANTTMPALLAREDGAYAKKLLLNHVILNEGANRQTIEGLFNLTDSAFLTTAAGQTIYVSRNLADEPTISDMLGRAGLLVDQDEQYEKDYLIVVDSVLMPDMAESLGELYDLLPGHFGLFHAAVNKTSYKTVLNETATNYTMLTPFNQAWMSYASRVGVTIDALMSNVDLLESMVGSSLYKGAALSIADFADAGSEVVYTMAYKSSTFTAEYNDVASLLMLTGGGAEIGHSTFVIEADLVAGGSFVQGIDQLLVSDDAGYGAYIGSSVDYTDASGAEGSA